jgi:putative addiction module killer protein/probable addiction module antidote protein
VFVRLRRVRLGNLGDCKPVGEGVSELRIKTGPGYRLYFGQDGGTLVVILCGGNKATQRKDIADAKRYWSDYRSRDMPRSVPFDDYLIESLKDRRLAEAYLNAALEEDDPRVFLLALRDVAQARGMSKLAAKTRLNRESLYKMLSKRGNPSLQSLGALLDGLGFRLAVESKDAA